MSFKTNKNSYTKSAISDTCLFVVGAIIGIIIDINIESIHKYITNFLSDTNNLICIGLLQLLINAMVIQFFREQFPKMGFFTMGLLSYQSLYIKKLYAKNN